MTSPGCQGTQGPFLKRHHFVTTGRHLPESIRCHRGHGHPAKQHRDGRNPPKTNMRIVQIGWMIIYKGWFFNPGLLDYKVGWIVLVLVHTNPAVQNPGWLGYRGDYPADWNKPTYG